MSVDKDHRRELYRGCIAIAKVLKEVAGRSKTDSMLEKVTTAAEYVFLFLNLPL